MINKLSYWELEKEGGDKLNTNIKFSIFTVYKLVQESQEHLLAEITEAIHQLLLDFKHGFELP